MIDGSVCAHSRNGTITVAEMASAMSSLAVGASAGEIAMLVRMCDDNGDGGIDFHEFSERLVKGHGLRVAGVFDPSAEVHPLYAAAPGWG